MMTGSVSNTADGEKRRSPLVVFVTRLVKEKPLGTVGAVIALLLLFTGIFADLIAPYGMNDAGVGENLSPPSARFWLGTDNLGRDMLSRIIYGARVSVIVGITGSVFATVISVIIGIVSGYSGGRIDLVTQRVIDIWMCFPELLISLVIITIMRPSLWSIIFTLGFTWGVPGSRIVRGAVIAIKQDVYMEAAESIGCSTIRVFARHVLPNITATIVVLFTIRVPALVLAEASLSFLGFGIPPPVPTWGGMLSGSGRDWMYLAPWMALWPGLALTIVVYGVNVFGDAVRDLLDPRLKGGAGRYGVKANAGRRR